MKIQYLYVKKCPHWEEGLKVLKETLKELKIRGRVRLVEVKTESQAEKLNFIGSPTIRMEDLEIDRFPLKLAEELKTLKVSGWREVLKSQKHTGKPGLYCRKYKFKGKYFSYPSREMIKDFIRNISVCLEIDFCCR